MHCDFCLCVFEPDINWAHSQFMKSLCDKLHDYWCKDKANM